MNNIDISIVIPAKNEAKRLPVFLNTLIDFCKKSKNRYEIVIVDDGSSDDTSQRAKEYSKVFPPLRVVTLEKNFGKGYAVKKGFEVCQGKVLVFLDADGSTPADEIEKNLFYLDQGYDIVVGSRALQNRNVEAKNYRKFIGFIFRFFVAQFLFREIQDTQCGFKMFKKPVAQGLFSLLTIPGFGFDLEILYLAKRSGYKMIEVPVYWHHVDDSKIDLMKDSFRMFMNIFQVRFRHAGRK